MTTKKTTKKNDPWADVKPVTSTAQPEKVSDNPEEGSPFGSMTPIMKLMSGFRKHWKENPVEKRGRATAPDGTVYGYYLTEDVLAAAYSYCDANRGFLDIGLAIDEQGNNVMEMTLVDTESSGFKHVQCNLGKPQSSADFGSRITYAPKYLVAVMFGISIQTDSDAFNNGKNIEHESRQPEPVANPAIYNPSSDGGTPVTPATPLPTGGAVSTSSDSTGGGGSSPVSGQGQPTVEHSSSYNTAKPFIERAINEESLNIAEGKIKTAKQLHDFERVELTELIAKRREELKKLAK